MGEKEIESAMSSEKLSSSASRTSPMAFTSFLETVSDALIIIDRTATIQYVNARAVGLLGVSRQITPGITLWQAVPQLVSTPFYQAVNTALQTQESLEVTACLFKDTLQDAPGRTSNDQQWLHAHLSPTVGGILILFSQERGSAQISPARCQAPQWYLPRDVSQKNDQLEKSQQWVRMWTSLEECKKVETALYQSQQWVRMLMDSKMIGIFIAKGKKIIEANMTFLHMTGYSQEELSQGNTGWSPLDLLDQASIDKQEPSHDQSPRPSEKEYVCKDGRHLPVLVYTEALPFDASQRLCFVLDNSARKELELRKENFLSIASHELRTPLTAVKMRLQLAHMRLLKQGFAEAASVLSRVEESVQLLDRLIGELLNVASLRVGRLGYVQEPVHIEALIYDIVDMLQAMYTTHTILVRGSAPCILIGDKGHLEQIFINLITNAIMYSPDASTVEIDLAATTEEMCVRVRDYGIGIPQEQQEQIFECFYRGFMLSQRATPGLGVGLTIAQEIVRKHGGTITVESKEGQGSTFQVTLPLKNPHGGEASS